jgi:hypothetical protein
MELFITVSPSKDIPFLGNNTTKIRELKVVEIENKYLRMGC